MFTLNTILKEMKEVPANRLEELYHFVHSLTARTNKSDAMRKKILSYAGAFSDMSDEDYADFLKQTKETRSELFNRNMNP